VSGYRKGMPLVYFFNEEAQEKIADTICAAVPSKGDTVLVATPKGNVFGEVIGVSWRVHPTLRTVAIVSLRGIVVHPLDKLDVEYFASLGKPE
jgi:hypothetical protein